MEKKALTMFLGLQYRVFLVKYVQLGKYVVKEFFKEIQTISPTPESLCQDLHFKNTPVNSWASQSLVCTLWEGLPSLCENLVEILIQLNLNAI